MVILDEKKDYSRYDDILYADGIPIVKFTVGTFSDWGLESATKQCLSLGGVRYMQKYINLYPNNYEIMKQESKIKKFFYDVETTGINWRRCSIHQLSAWIEIDGVVVEKLNLLIKPHPKAEIEQTALDICKVTEEQIQAYSSMEGQFQVLLATLKRYVDPYSKGDKFFMVGFKNASFDDDFLKKYFELMNSKFFFYFYANSIDVSCLAAQYLINIRSSMPSFKLHRVAKTVGIHVDEERLHDADYDVYLTREVYNTVSRIEENIF
jgi:DNA polymerase-3 subunit epsilon